MQHAVSLAFDDVIGWRERLDEALAATGGTLTDEERAWVDRIFSGDLGPGTPAV